LLRSSGDDSKAAHLRQPLPRDVISHKMFLFFFAPTKETVPTRKRLA